MKNSGQMLVELVIGVGIIILVLVGVVLLSTLSVKNSRTSGNRSEATVLADRELELVRKSRDSDVAAFFAISGPQSCLSEGDLPEGYSCSSDYARNGDEMTVGVTVSWADGLVIIESVFVNQ